ncbi:unnamed protein product [Brachionus calyciflorus]|uniref:Serine/threonine-protein kinase ATR n=1 Tax=Brachionus calyciflorus TaxID=104777 RepID=A0A814D5K5_9BILA|nr:unnamed protein product [Brachionus calyciflorus]
MCQHDSFIIEDYKNPLIEFTKNFIFSQINQPLVTSTTLDNTTTSDSVFIQLIFYWTAISNEQKNLSLCHISYTHALNCLKSIYLSSIEWKKSVSQNVVAFLSLPWLAQETNPYDLELFKDKTLKQSSLSLIQNTDRNILNLIKSKCIQLLCLIPKNACDQWRVQLITKCLRQESDDEIRITTLKYLPFLIYFLGVSSNALVFQLIHPAMNEEKSLNVLKYYSIFLGKICCLISRKCMILRKTSCTVNLEPDQNKNHFSFNEMSDNFNLVCTFCDKKFIDTKILPRIGKRKNSDFIQMLFNRPKLVDTQVIMKFVYILSGTRGFLNSPENLVIEVKSLLLQNLERVFNHLEFSRKLNQQALISHEFSDLNNFPSSNSAQLNNTNLTLIYKEALNLLADDTLNIKIRFEFAKYSIPKLLSQNSHGQISNQDSFNQKNSDKQILNDEIINKAMSTSIQAISNPNEQLDHNFNLENQLCEGILRSKNSKNLLDLYMYTLSLGRYALHLKKPDEYLFICVKHLIEIIDSNLNDEWSSLAKSLAQRQLFMLSKNINIQDLLREFEEKVCEIIAETIYNSVKRSISNQLTINSSYLQNANQSLKNVLKVFNYTDSCSFVRSYQRYIIPFLTHRATENSDYAHKTITKALEFLSRKLNSNVTKLIEDNFPYIFTYTTLNSNEIAQVFHYITDEVCLDIDKLINYNKQRVFNELLSRCGNPKYKLKVWQAICVLTAKDSDEAAQLVTMQIDDSRIVKSIEPGLLAVLLHFDMCLLKSSINLKEKCQVLESLNVLMGTLGTHFITQVRYKLMTTLKLAMQQCSKLSELNCKLWDTFLRNVDKTALGPILNQVSVNLLQLLDSQPYKISKIFEYLIIQNKDHLSPYFSELYFIPENNYLIQVNQTLKKYTDIKYISDLNSTNLGQNFNNNSNNTNKAIVYSIQQYLKGALHENADLRVKALEKLYALLKEKSSQIVQLIERQENSQIISEIVIALLNGCRDTDQRAKILFGSCLGEIGAIDPANVAVTGSTNSSNLNTSKKLNSSLSSSVQNQSNTSMSSSILSSSELLLNPSLVSEDSNEFSENFSYSLIVELSKAYLAARNTHEQDSASYAIQECLKIYECNGSNKIQNTKLWNSFPDHFKEILTPLRSSKYEIQSFDNLGALKTPIILNECKIYEEWVYKWCAFLISKIATHFNSNNVIDVNSPLYDKELKVFPKLQFIIRFNVNVALFILPYVIIKMIIQNLSNEIIDQIFEEIMSVIQLNQFAFSVSPNNSVSAGPGANLTPCLSNTKILQYHHICCQTIFNIYDHLMKQLHHYRTKMNELQATLNSKSKSKMSNRATVNSVSEKQTANEILLCKYKDLFELFNKFIQRIPQKTISKAAFECKAYCRSLMHYELYMRNTPGAVQIQGSTINIKQEHLVELQNLYASMDEIDAASGILLLKKGSEESLADAAFRHKINGRLNESIACIEQMLESNENAKCDIKQHENYIRTFISIGRYRNALSYLEGLMVDKPEWRDSLDSYRIEACWKLGSWDKLKTVVTSSSNKNSNLDNLENLCFSSESQPTNAPLFVANKDFLNSAERNMAFNSFNADIGKLFNLIANKNEKEFYETLTILREQQIGPLSAVSMEAGGNSYERGYEYVVNLQVLQEIESCLGEMLRLRNDTTDKEQYRNMLMKNLDSYLIEPWERRVLVMQPSFKHLEPIYNVRIALLNFLSSNLELNLTKQSAKLWLHLAKIARKAGMFENAYQYMLNAQGQIKSSDSSNLEELLVEKSKWYWQREDKDSALFYLQKGLNELFNNDTNSVDSSNNELYSKVLLMYTKFSEENGSVDSETIKKNYLEVQKMRKNTEQAHFELAQFLDRLATSVSENTGKKEKFWDYIYEIVSYYAMSLEYGCRFIYQSLPRMMSLWLDFGADYFDHSSRSANSSSSANRNLNHLNHILGKLNQTISNALQKIPTYAFLTVYPQLVSRICHPEERVFETLSNIIMKVLFLYQNQAIWMLIAVKNSSVELRKNRCKIIIDKAIRQQPDLRKFINDSSELAEKLVQLGNLNVETGVTSLSLANSFRPLKKIVESKDFSRLLIPSQFQVTLQLPSNENNTNSSTNSNLNQNFRTHNPYPLELVYISNFEDNVLVMNSLQKPKKVTIRGTDGKLYSFLCKAKDDLRIDYRIMEFFSVVNKCLKQEPESRRRNLYIRTYAVTPLNENSGIIEWIENLSTLRQILIKLYNERGVGPVTSAEWRQHEDKINRDKEYALKVFKMFLEKYRPTVLYEWFLRTFPEPNAWYNARCNYTRTAAVMSVCGYVLGLGDRHCENILMESSNGDCIHVDFNCLFNKGETLGVPEIVPFRLTHNMTEAMGPLGFEGCYRKTCEVTLKILRDYKEPLLTILKTFIYDPLVEWKTPGYKSNESGETISAKGQVHLQNITCRLKGMHTKQWITTSSRVKALPLSVEGHVNTLIKESTDDRNLSAMYIGWSAFF